MNGVRDKDGVGRNSPGELAGDAKTSVSPGQGTYAGLRGGVHHSTCCQWGQAVGMRGESKQ